VLFRKTSRDESVVNGSGKRNVQNSARVNVSHFGVPKAKFPAAKTMRMNGDLWPRQNTLFKSLEVLHQAPSILLFDAHLMKHDSIAERFDHEQ
jgi:hypothetical protein